MKVGGGGGDTLPIGMLGTVTSTFDGRILAINETLATALGYTTAEILEAGFQGVLTPDEWQAGDLRALAELRSTGHAALREKQCFRKDGSRMWIMIGSACAENDRETIVSFAVDVTARKHAETTRRVDEDAARLAAIVESSDDAIIGETLAGVVTTWNRGASKLFGYAADEVLGRPITLLIPAGREHEEQDLLDSLLCGEAAHLDTVRRHKDGREIEISVTISPIYDARGNVVGASKFARDITERRRFERDLIRAKEDADAASRELETFSYSVAHDLRAPLRGITSFARILLTDHAGSLDADGKDCLDEVLSSATKMASLIDALLALSRVTRTELRRERTDLAELARAAVTELAAGQPERTVEMIIPDHLEVSLDRRLARVLVENLIGNAWKFTSRTVGARIEIGVADRDGVPVYFVRDNGAGFDMAHSKNLFGPFQRLHTVGEFPGTGVGLSTVQRIVLRHGGRIWAEASVNGGAMFSFTLPPGSTEGTSCPS